MQYMHVSRNGGLSAPLAVLQLVTPKAPADAIEPFPSPSITLASARLPTALSSLSANIPSRDPRLFSLCSSASVCVLSLHGAWDAPHLVFRHSDQGTRHQSSTWQAQNTSVTHGFTEYSESVTRRLYLSALVRHTAALRLRVQLSPSARHLLLQTAYSP